MAMRQLFVEKGETLEDAKRREEREAPHGRCGDHAKPDEYQGCGTPLPDDEWYVCEDFPDCCRP
ncbi:hypothetical protein H7Y29_01955 [Microbacteriaceae bacterium]|nr:hypothetical protein [Candidatus Saccharibacteria bacterium]